MIDYCTAEHSRAEYGCYGELYHDGKHWSWASRVRGDEGVRETTNGLIWEWDNEAPEVPAGSAAVVLTESQIAVLLASVVGLEAVIPGLAKPIIEKLTTARESIK